MSVLPRFTPSRLALALLVCSPLLQANDDAIEHIQVSATRSSAPVSTVPATISVITQEQIASQLAFTQDISAILGNMLPGFSPSRQKLTSAGETLRGREPLYMIDGVPQSNPLRNGSRDGKTIDPAMIERIEVIRGPMSALYGSDAIGGVVNVITRKGAALDGGEFSASWQWPQATRRARVSWGKRLDSELELMVSAAIPPHDQKHDAACPDDEGIGHDVRNADQGAQKAKHQRAGDDHQPCHAPGGNAGVGRLFLPEFAQEKIMSAEIYS